MAKKKSKKPAAKKKAAAKKKPAAKKKAAAKKKPAAKKTPAAEKTPAAKKTPAARKKPAAREVVRPSAAPAAVPDFAVAPSPAPAPAPTPTPSAAGAPAPESLYPQVQRFALKLLLGGAVRVPVTRLQEVARLAWFADERAEPELRVDAPVGAKLPTWSSTTSGIETSPAGPGESLRLASAGSNAWLDEVTPWVSALPDGAVIELVAASPASLDDGVLLRCCGPVREGTWEIVSTYPPLSRDRLESALTLSLAGPSDQQEARARFRDEFADVWPLA